MVPASAPPHYVGSNGHVLGLESHLRSQDIQFEFRGSLLSAKSLPVICNSHNVSRNVVRLQLYGRNTLDSIMHQLICLFPWLRSPFLRPVWLLPANFILKKEKPDWATEYNNEIREYEDKLRGLRSTVEYYGEAFYNGERAILLSDGGATLNDPQDITGEALRPLLANALKDLARRKVVHENLSLVNVLCKKKRRRFLFLLPPTYDVKIIDFEQTSSQVEGLNIDAEVSELIDMFIARQKQIKAGNI